MEDATSEGTTHDLLLALAGRVDDDLLAWARELVALGEDARAVEMLAASLIAARAVLPPPVHAALVAATRAARTDLGPTATLPPPHPEDTTEHRFAAPDGGDPVAGAVLDLPARPLTGCSVLLARRLTPAGSAPGPLPHPVVLVRVHAGSRPADVIAYQVATALQRAEATASVEVLPADGPMPDYHAAALDCAVQLRGDDAAVRPLRPAPPADRYEDPTTVPEQPHPLASPAGRDLAPAPEREPGDLFVDRSTPTSARQIPDPDVDPPARLRDPELQAIADSVAATARQPADERPPEREPEGVDAATVRLPAEPGHVHLFDDNPRDENQDAYEDDDYQHHEDDLRDDEDDDSDYRDDYGDDYRDDAPDTREPAEETFPEPPSPHPLAPPRPLPVRHESGPAGPMPAPTSTSRPRPTVTPISRPPVPTPIPLIRRSGPAPIRRPPPVAEQRPALRRIDDDQDDLEPRVEERAEHPSDRLAPRPQQSQPARGETPAFDSLSDPLNGPLHQPLLAPLLDPTNPEDDPLGQMPPADRRREPEEPQDDEWSEEWLSGTWAMAPSALDERPVARPRREPDPDPAVEFGRPSPRPAPRHRYANEPPAPNGSPRPENDRVIDGEVVEPTGRDAEDRDPERPDLGLRPESIARLSDGDRQLLARLQAELLEGRRQRIGRRIINGTGATANGNHRGPPPDLIS